jgi:hypothetical protein
MVESIGAADRVLQSTAKATSSMYEWEDNMNIYVQEIYLKVGPKWNYLSAHTNHIYFA